MKRMNGKGIIVLLVMVMCLLGSKSFAQHVNYYIDSLKGSDANNGTTTATPWQTVTKVNATTFKPGDSVLFNCGSVWSGITLHPLGSGTSGNPIVISKYGTGNLPLIKGNTPSAHLPYVVYLANQQYITISNLEITNNYQESSSATASKRGVYVTAKDIGIVHCVTLKDLVIHDVLGSYYSDVTTGGIFCEITGTKTHTWYDSLLIDHCHVYNVDRTGISNQSSWGGSRSITSNSGWYPSTHLVVQNCEVDSSGANSMIIRVAQTPIIQYNKVFKSSIRYSGNSIFVFDCDDAIIQYNEGSFNVFNSGDADASAFDGDYRCHRTVIQYNYSHDNDGGAWVVVSDPSISNTFDDSCIIRYNISQNDCHSNAAQEQAVVRIDGNITNTFVYNNTIYSSKDFIALINHCGWGGSKTGTLPVTTSYYNNIFYINKNNALFSFNTSTGNTIKNNTFYYAPGYSGSSPIDSFGLTTDPMFANPGTATNSIYSVNGYMLLKGSPCIATGMFLPNHAKYDYSGIPVPAQIGQAPCRGALEFLMDWAVVLASFSGEQSGSHNILKWVTTEEINNTGFEVQRSNDGINFYDIYFVPTNTASGNSVGNINYQYTDYTLIAGNNYYRLKQIDKDGHVQISAVILLRNNSKTLPSITINPNPVKAGNHFAFSLNNIPDGKYSLSVMDINGKALFSQQFNHKEQDVEKSINNNIMVPHGMYILSIKNDTINVSAKMMVE